MQSATNNIQPDCTDFRSVARALTIVENDLQGADDLLKSLTFTKSSPVIGITGPPGAGKSTLVNSLISGLLNNGNKIAILAIDPTSPFNFGSLLGDRIRMAPHFNHPDVFIRSLATRGSLGGLSAKAIEMTDVLRAAGFDYILIETVGVGQSEIEIAGLADITLLVLSDRADADLFANNLKKIQLKENKLPVYKTVASKNEGIDEVINFILSKSETKNSRKELLLAEKAYSIIRQKRMADIDKKKLQQDIAKALGKPGFNLYQFISPLTP